MNTLTLVDILKDAQQDFEWYPTTREMVQTILRDLQAKWSMPKERCESVLDIGAGDGRVLMMFAELFESSKLYAIERSTILQQQQPDIIIPVGAEFEEQDLMSVPVDVAFCNPPYSVFEQWAYRIITTVHTHYLYLILPRRWRHSDVIAGALKMRQLTHEIIGQFDFANAERQARAEVDIIRIHFGESDEQYYHYRSERQDPFDIWFDQNIDTFDREEPLKDYQVKERTIARLHKLDSIPSLVAAYQEDYDRMEANYRSIFKLDASLLKELGVDKKSVREGLKQKIQGLKHVYWKALFDKLDVITTRLTTQTKRTFLERLTGQTSIAFTATNAYAIVLWAIRAANQYFDVQIVDVFREMSTHDGVTNYKSNVKTWEKDGWRYNAAKHDHYILDYRIVLHHFRAIYNSNDTFGAYDYPGNLHDSCHQVIDDLIAVFNNLGFFVKARIPSRTRKWYSNSWQDFCDADGRVIFQVKAFLNGNMHFRIDQKAIKALNIEAGRLLGWLRSPQEAAAETGCTAEEAAEFFGANRHLGQSSVRLLAATTA